jgi:hypothetical protein
MLSKFIGSLATAIALGFAAHAVNAATYVGPDAAEAYAAFVAPSDEAVKQFGGDCFLNAGEPLDHLKDSDCLPKIGAKKTAILWGDSAMAMYGRDLRVGNSADVINRPESENAIANPL